MVKLQLLAFNMSFWTVLALVIYFDRSHSLLRIHEFGDHRNWRLRHPTLWTKQPQVPQQDGSIKYSNDNDVELTRAGLVAIIDDSWRRVRRLMSPILLEQCEDELKGATSLLVLATVRKAADANAESRATVEQMFKEADKDGDGQITFLEWFEWVSQDAYFFGSDEINDAAEEDAANIQNNQEGDINTRRRQIGKWKRSQKQRNTLEQFEDRQLVKDPTLEKLDPMVEGLAQVLGHAVCTLQVAARFPSDDPSYLAAAFVAGGTMAGVMDETLTRTMLSRLSSRTRDLVAIALTLEVASMETESELEGGMGVMFEELDDARAKSMPDVSHSMVEGSKESYETKGVDGTESDREYVDITEGGSRSPEATNIDVIQTVDLSSIPIKSAPPIEEPVPVATVAIPFSTSRNEEDNIDDFEESFGIISAPPPLQVEAEETKLSIDEDEHGREEGVNSWKVEDDVIVESNKFEVEARPAIYVGELIDTKVYGEKESIPVDTVLAASGAPSAEGESDDVRSRDLVSAIANAPPEKDEKLIILRKSEDLYDDISDSHLDESQVEVLPRHDLASTGQEPTSYIQGSKGASRSDGESLNSWDQADNRQQYGLALGSQGLDSTIQKAGSIAADISALRSAFKELDDSQSRLMRHLIFSKSGGRGDILGLSMALRVCRLQNANILGHQSKSRLAMETLQLWAPISFQMGMNNKLPELEVHSYVLLFPRSFSSFINWYTAFRPIAKKVITKFQEDLEDALLADPIIPRFASKVLIQSRLKSPSSAFKKMVKSDSKQRHQLYDMLGVRVIITDRPVNPMEPMVSNYFDMNVYETVNTECDFDFEVEGDTAGAFSDEEERDELLISLVNGKNANYAAQYGEEQENEARVVSYMKDLILALPRWGSDKARFKDYVANPKMSGYQSMHMTLVHAATGVNLEVQLRSARMHLEAEYGRASHSNYKGMMLPAIVDSKGSDDT